MRKITVLLIAWVLVLMLALCGCVSNPSGQDSGTESGNSKNSNIESTNDVSLQKAEYEIVTEEKNFSYQEGKVVIKQSYQLVVLKGEGENITAINNKLKEYMDAFFMDEDEMTKTAEAVAHNQDMELFNLSKAEVVHNEGGIISLKLKADRFMGGTLPQNLYGYTFDLNTGKQLCLSELLDREKGALTEELKNIVCTYMDEEIYAEYGTEHKFDRSYLESYDADGFKFCIEKGEIVLLFSTYEIADGATGPIFIPTGIQVAA